MRSVEQIINRQISRWNSMAQTLGYEPGLSETVTEEAAPVAPSKHPVICITRHLGVGAREVCQGVCDRLNYSVFGTGIIDELANHMNVTRRIIDSLDEKGRSGLELMFETYVRGREIDREEYVAHLARVVQALAFKGGLVLLGRGAGFILGEQSALNVLITGAKEDRIRRVMEYDNLEEAAARKKIEEHDTQRDRFLKKMLRVDPNDLLNYDVVINTSRVAPEAAAGVILCGLEARGYDLDKLRLPDPGEVEND